MTTKHTDLMGLTCDKKGQLYLGGKIFNGYGVNSFTAISRYVGDNPQPTFESQFQLLKKYNIPFVRVNFGGYYPAYYDKFDKNPAEIIGKIREVVECAEKYQIGLVCSLLWYDGSLSAHIGERRSAMGDINSKTAEYTRQYVSKMVSEFKDSPAIWAWEIGNEYNLDTDLFDKDVKNFLPRGITFEGGNNYYDYYTSEELVTYMKLVGEEIRKIDKNRIISTGHGDMRIASKALHLAGCKCDENHAWEMDWKHDSIEDFYEMCEYFTPDPFDTVCLHIQHGRTNNDGHNEYINVWERFGEKISTEEYFKAYITAAEKIGKVMYFGEIGDLMCMEGALDAAEYFDDLINLFLKIGVVFASSWQFMANGLVASDTGLDGEKLKSIQKANIHFSKIGKQNLDEYWKNYSK